MPPGSPAQPASLLPHGPACAPSSQQALTALTGRMRGQLNAQGRSGIKGARLPPLQRPLLPPPASAQPALPPPSLPRALVPPQPSCGGRCCSNPRRPLHSSPWGRRCPAPTMQVPLQAPQTPATERRRQRPRYLYRPPSQKIELPVGIPGHFQHTHAPLNPCRSTSS